MKKPLHGKPLPNHHEPLVARIGLEVGCEENSTWEPSPRYQILWLWRARNTKPAAAVSLPAVWAWSFTRARKICSFSRRQSQTKGIDPILGQVNSPPILVHWHGDFLTHGRISADSAGLGPRSCTTSRLNPPARELFWLTAEFSVLGPPGLATSLGSVQLERLRGNGFLGIP